MSPHNVAAGPRRRLQILVDVLVPQPVATLSTPWGEADLRTSLDVSVRSRASDAGTAAGHGEDQVFLIKWPLSYQFFTQNRCILKDFG